MWANVHVRKASAQSALSIRQISNVGSNNMSVGSASPVFRGLAMVPRRISGIQRTDSGEMNVLQRMFVTSRPPIDIAPDLDQVVQEVFECTLKRLRGHCARDEFQEVELLLFKKARRVADRVKALTTSREDGLDDAMQEQLTSDRASPDSGRSSPVTRLRRLLFWKHSQPKSLSRTLTGTDLSTYTEFTAWLTEFLFILWYSSLAPGQDQSIGSIRQVCKQLVWRATCSRTTHTKRVRFFSPILKLFPWRMRLLLGEAGPMGERSWKELQYDPFDRDRLKASTMNQPMLHWLTREFADPSLEKSFHADYANRLMKSPFWPFFLTVVLAVSYVVVQYGLIQAEYPSITLVRLFITEPVSWLIVAAIVQLVGISVLFSDSSDFIENFFFYQFLFATSVCCLTAVWMYEVRLMFVFVAWPINEGFTMSFILVCASFLFYVRFIYLLWLSLITVAFTLAMRSALLGSVDVDLVATFPLQQGLAVVAAFCVVLSGRYLFETHTRVDFLLTRTLFAESERSDRLLRNILPEQVIEHLKEHDQTLSVGTIGPHRLNHLQASPSLGIAEAYDSVSILFADVCSFTTYSSHVSPEELVLFLNELFTCFDDIAEETGLEKIKTIGDAYMAVSGLNHDKATLHAVCAARMGLQIVELMKSGQFRDHENNSQSTRVGIHSGACVAGVIGRKKFIYDIWGDAVNTASRMESTGDVNMVHCSEATASLIDAQSQGGFELVPRGEIDVKGKGIMKTYFILGERAYISPIPEVTEDGMNQNS